MHLMTRALGGGISCVSLSIMHKMQKNFREGTLGHSEHGETCAKQFPESSLTIS